MQIVIDPDNKVLGWGEVSVGPSKVDGEGVERADVTFEGGGLLGANLAAITVIEGVEDADLTDGDYTYDPDTGTVIKVE